MALALNLYHQSGHQFSYCYLYRQSQGGPIPGLLSVAQADPTKTTRGPLAILFPHRALGKQHARTSTSHTAPVSLPLERPGIWLPVFLTSLGRGEVAEVGGRLSLPHHHTLRLFWLFSDQLEGHPLSKSNHYSKEVRNRQSHAQQSPFPQETSRFLKTGFNNTISLKKKRFQYH